MASAEMLRRTWDMPANELTRTVEAALGRRTDAAALLALGRMLADLERTEVRV